MIVVTQIEQEVNLTVDPTTELINIQVTETLSPTVIVIEVSENVIITPNEPTDNIPKFIAFTHNNAVLTAIHTRINQMETFEILANEVFFVKKVVYNLDDNLPPNRIFFKTEKYIVKDTGKGLYGIDGTQIEASNIELLYSSSVTALDVIEIPNSQIIVIQDLQGLSISEYINTINPSIEFQEVDVAPRIIRVTGVADYLFLPVGGLYGFNDINTTVEQDYQLLNSVPVNLTPTFQQVTDVEPPFTTHAVGSSSAFYTGSFLEWLQGDLTARFMALWVDVGLIIKDEGTKKPIIFKNGINDNTITLIAQNKPEAEYQIADTEDVANLQTQIDGVIESEENSPWKTSAVLAINYNLVSNASVLILPSLVQQGVTLVNGARLLVIAETNTALNGLYRLNSANLQLYRTSDANSSTNLNNALVPISQGVYAGKVYRQTTVNPVIFTDPIIFEQFSAVAPLASAILAGIMKIYAVLGNNTDGTISQKIMTESLATKSDKQSYMRLQVDYILTSQTALQKIFNVGSANNGSVAVIAEKRYKFFLRLHVTGLSATSGTVSGGFLGTATPEKIHLTSTAAKSGLAISTPANAQIVQASTNNAFIVNTANTGTNLFLLIHGEVSFSSSGTFIPAIGMSIAAAATINNGAYFELSEIDLLTNNYSSNVN